MEKFYFEVPSISRKNDAIEYINEFYKFNSNINGTGGLQRFLNNYEEWLNKLQEDYTRIANEEKVPARTYFLVRSNDNKIVGMINIRLALNEKLKRYGGHIGYSIRPTERGKGYNKINLYLGLIEARKLGLDKVMLDCDVNNLGSARTMQALGGILERTEVDPYDGLLTSVYWFDVDETIEKYKEIFKDNIYINNNVTKR